MSPLGPISAKFGPEVQTTYSGSPFNRLSFLREDQEFLNAALHSSSARFLPFKDFNALIGSESLRLHWLTLAEVGEEIIGEPYSQKVDDLVKNWDPRTGASGASHAQIVFLGIDESEKSWGWKEYKGAPRFAVDLNVYDHSLEDLKPRVEALTDKLTDDGKFEFMNVFMGPGLKSKPDYGTIAESRIILDWINRTRFCGGCGHRNMSAWGGFKLLCPDAMAGRSDCPTKGRLTNLSFPRTDCCIICAVVSFDGKQVLIGRHRRFPGKMYSTLAGFLEPGESIEDCVRREIWEEAGVKVGRVLLYSTQPWPYPSNIMIGCVAEIAEPSAEAHEISLGHDKELADAKWVTIDELQKAIKGDADFSVPPKSSIAGILLEEAAKGALLKPQHNL